MSLSLAPRPDKWSVRKAMDKDIQLVADWEAKVTIGGDGIRAARIEGLKEELRFDHADMVEKDKRPVCWVGNWCNGDAGSYFLSATPAPAITTITPLVECWRTILDHYFIHQKQKAELVRVNADPADETLVDLLRAVGFRDAPATTDAPDYLNIDDPFIALICTRQNYLDLRDRKYPELH